MRKIAQLHLDLLKKFYEVDGKELVGVSLAELLKSFDFSNKISVLTAATEVLRRQEYIEKVGGSTSTKIILTEQGREAIGVENPSDAFEEVANHAAKQERKSSFEIDETNKEKAILSLINDTLLKTVMYCKDLSSQLDTVDREEELLRTQKEIEVLSQRNERDKMIIESLESTITTLRDSLEISMGLLKIGIDDKIEEFFNLIPWQREYAKEQFKSGLMMLVQETLEDIQKSTEKE